jgi:hypothetical protein
MWGCSGAGVEAWRRGRGAEAPQATGRERVRGRACGGSGREPVSLEALPLPESMAHGEGDRQGDTSPQNTSRIFWRRRIIGRADGVEAQLCSGKLSA